jgi:hypothetical protein
MGIRGTKAFKEVFLMRTGRAFSVVVALAAAMLVAAAARAQSPLPAPVERAIAEAEARSDPKQRWAFTRTYTRSGETIVARFDPRRPEEWRLTTPPSEDALTKDQREMFTDIQAESGPMADRAVMITPPEEPGPRAPQSLGGFDTHRGRSERETLRLPVARAASSGRGRRTQVVDEAC